MAIIDNGGGMDGPVAAEWNLLAGGKSNLPTGEGIPVGFFGTGHVAALSHLAFDNEIIVATLRNEHATLIRWGKPVTDAVHRELGDLRDNDLKRTLQNAVITINMQTRRLVDEPGLSKGASEVASSLDVALCGELH